MASRWMDARCCPRRSRKEQLAVCVLPHQDECIDRLNWCGCERQSEWRVRARFGKGVGGARGCGAGAEDRRAGSESARAGPPDGGVRAPPSSELAVGRRIGERNGRKMWKHCSFDFSCFLVSRNGTGTRTASADRSGFRRCVLASTRLVRRAQVRHGTPRRAAWGRGWPLRTHGCIRIIQAKRSISGVCCTAS